MVNNGHQLAVWSERATSGSFFFMWKWNRGTSENHSKKSWIGLWTYNMMKLEGTMVCKGKQQWCCFNKSDIKWLIMVISLLYGVSEQLLAVFSLYESGIEGPQKIIPKRNHPIMNLSLRKRWSKILCRVPPTRRATEMVPNRLQCVPSCILSSVGFVEPRIVFLSFPVKKKFYEEKQICMIQVSLAILVWFRLILW